MNLVIDNKEYFDAIFYVKEQPNNNNNLCVVCLMDEKEEGKNWTKTTTICGHICHSRCFRRWCGYKGCINCPLCGDIQEIKKNRFCNACKKFGHCDILDGCPKIEKQIKKEMILQKNNRLIYVM